MLFGITVSSGCGGAIAPEGTYENFADGEADGGAGRGGGNGNGNDPAGGGNAAESTSVTYTVSTLAGSGVGWWRDGTATAAMFWWPTALAVDGSGTVFVADAANQRIRKVTPAGEVTTLAGNGEKPFADGTGAAATFDLPQGIAAGSDGNVYVADTFHHRIRKITPGGVVTTLAGSGYPGAANGTGAAATFHHPWGIAIDTAGNIYVADAFNHLVRKVTPAGVVTTLAGSVQGLADGVGSSAQFNNLAGVAVDAAGNVYVADTSNSAIRKVTPEGAVTTLAGSGKVGRVDGPGAIATFDDPTGVAVDAAGDLFVADHRNNRIRKVTASGVVSTIAGSNASTYVDGAADIASFYMPRGIAIDSAGTLYVADSNHNTIRKITRTVR